MANRTLKPSISRPSLTSSYNVRRAGRGEPVTVEIFGTVQEIDGRAEIKTDIIKEVDPQVVIDRINDRGYSVAQVLAEGYNVMIVKAARASAMEFRQTLIDAGLATGNKEALGMARALHVLAGKLGKDERALVDQLAASK